MWDAFNHALAKGWATENTFMIDLIFRDPILYIQSLKDQLTIVRS